MITRETKDGLFMIAVIVVLLIVGSFLFGCKAMLGGLL